MTNREHRNVIGQISPVKLGDIRNRLSSSLPILFLSIVGDIYLKVATLHVHEKFNRRESEHKGNFSVFDGNIVKFPKETTRNGLSMKVFVSCALCDVSVNDRWASLCLSRI